MKKNRKLHKGRFFALLFGLILIVFGIGWSIYHVWDGHVQNKRHEYVQNVVLEYKEVLKYVDGFSIESVSEDSLSELKQLAQDGIQADYNSVKKWNAEDVRIDKDAYESLQSMKSPKKDSYYKLIRLLPSMKDRAQNYVDFVLREPESRIGFALEFKNRDQHMEPVLHHGASLKNVPSLLQWDPKWGFMEYGDMSLCFNGCAPTCLSMVFSYLNQDDTITPTKIATLSEQNGTYVNGVGTSHSLLDLAAREYGIQVSGVSVDRKALLNVLQNDKICILSVNPGDFTSIGHFIVVYGVKDGKLQVRDPNSKIRTEKLWDVDRVVQQTRSIWAYSKGR